MLFTATTVKDSVDNVAFFVAANLASGADHLLVFLDAPKDPGQPEVAAMLHEHPHVTCVPTTRGSWWAGERPASLNVRQRSNAGWARSVLAPLPWAEWLFHIDGDEVACLDRSALAAVPAGVDAVWLPPWEAVSEWAASARPTRFKRLLDDADLTLLQVLGRLSEPSNQAYFHGHVMGKSGVRPASGLGLTLHDAVTPAGHKVERHQDPRLKVLHYDAPSGEEFARKWTALAEAGPARYRADRAPTAKALRRLVTSDLPEETRSRYLREIYDRTTRDDVAALADLRLLAEADPVHGGSTPRALDADQRARLAERVAELAEGPKGGYLVEDAPADRSARAGTTTAKDQLRRLTRRT